MEWNKDLWSCWITPCDDSCICVWLNSSGRFWRIPVKSQWFVTPLSILTTFKSICWFSRNSVLLDVALEVLNLVWEEAASWSSLCMHFVDLFWVSLSYMGGVNLQKLIFLIGREEIMCLDHIPTFPPVD